MFDNEINLLFGVFCGLAFSSSEEQDFGLFFSLTGGLGLGFLMECVTPLLIPYFLLAGTDFVNFLVILLCCFGGVFKETLALKFLFRSFSASSFRMNLGTYDAPP